MKTVQYIWYVIYPVELGNVLVVIGVDKTIFLYI